MADTFSIDEAYAPPKRATFSVDEAYTPAGAPKVAPVSPVVEQPKVVVPSGLPPVARGPMPYQPKPKPQSTTIAAPPPGIVKTRIKDPWNRGMANLQSSLGAAASGVQMEKLDAMDAIDRMLTRGQAGPSGLRSEAAAAELDKALPRTGQQDPLTYAAALGDLDILEYARATTPQERAAVRQRVEGVYGSQVQEVVSGQVKAASIPKNPSVARAQQAKTFGEFWDAFSEAPGTFITDTVIESAPNMIPTVVGGALGGPVGGRAGFAAGAGAGSGVVELGSSIAQKLQELGADMEDPESIRRVLEEHETEIFEYARNRAIAVGLFDAMGARLAAGKMIPGRPAAEAVAQTVAGAGSGAGGEITASLATGETPNIGAVASEAIGEVAGQVKDIGQATAQGLRTEPPVNRRSLEQFLDAPQEPAQPSPPPAAPQQPEIAEPASATPGDGTAAAPRVVTTAEDLTEASSQAATSPMNPDAEPTQAQKEAGNYKKSHVRVHGLDISIENPKGSTRSGSSPEGNWSVTMPAHYGYIRRSEAADGDQIDVFIGDQVDAQEAYVIDQIDPTTGAYDEPKIVFGVADMVSAITTYDQSFSGGGQDRIGAVTPLSIDELKAWIKSGDTKKPIGNIAAAQRVIRDKLAEQQALAVQPGAAPAVPNQTQPAPSSLPKGIVPKRARRVAAPALDEPTPPPAKPQDLPFDASWHSGAKGRGYWASPQPGGAMTVWSPDGDLISNRTRDPNLAASLWHNAQKQERAGLSNTGESTGRGGADMTRNATQAVTGTPRQANSQAGEWTVKLGRQTGREYAVALDEKGKVVKASVGSNDRVEFDDLTIAALNDPANSFMIHHNHPIAAALSDQDLRNLARPGIGFVIAHNHDGTFSAARVSDGAWPELMVSADAAGKIESFYGRAWNLLLAIADPIARQNAVMEVLAGVGLVDYHTSMKPRPGFAAIVRQATETLTKEAVNVGWKFVQSGGLHRPTAYEHASGALAAISRLNAESAPGRQQLPRADQVGSGGGRLENRRREGPGAGSLQGPHETTRSGGGSLPEGVAFENQSERALIQRHLAPADTGRLFGLARSSFLEEVKRDGLGNSLVRNLVNALNPIFDYEKRAFGGAVRDASVSAAKMAEFTMNDTGRVWAMMKGGALRYNAADGIVEVAEGTKGLFDIFKYLGAPQTYDKFRLYAAARRGQRLMAEGRERNLTTEAIDLGLSYAENRGKYHGETRAFSQIFDDYQAFNAALLKGMGVDTGLLSQAQFDLFTEHMDYTPFYREMEDGKIPSVDWFKKGINKPDPKIKGLEGGESKIADLMDNIVKNAMAITRAGMRNVTMQRIYGLAEILGDGEIVREGSIEDGVLTYRVDGKETKFVVTDPSLVAAVAAMRPEQITGLHKAAAALTSFFRNGIVMMPGFMLRNLVRGSIAGFVQTGKNQSIAHNTATGFVRALSNARTVKEIKTISGTGAYTFGGPATDIGRKLRREIGAQTRIMPLKLTSKIYYALEHVGEATELADRDAIYNNMLRKGATKAEAAYQAMNLINYSRKGASKALRMVLPLVPFLNARIQGLYRMAETQKSGSDRVKILAGVAVRGLLLTAVSMLLRELTKDDDRYDDEPLHRKLNYYIIYAGDTRILIPKAFEFGAIFSTLPELLMDAVEQGESGRLAEGVAQTFLNTFAFNPIPQPLRPVIENIANFDMFTMRPIESYRLQNLPPGERAYSSTSDVVKEIGRATDTSPVMIENVIDGFTGQLGGLILAGLDSIGRTAGAFPEKPEGPFGGIPVLSELAENQFGSMVREGEDAANRWVGDFYELAREVDEASARIKILRQRGDTKGAADIARETPVGLKKVIDKQSRALADINRAIRSVEGSTRSAQEKKTKLNTLYATRNRITERTVKMVRRIEKKRDARATLEGEF